MLSLEVEKEREVSLGVIKKYTNGILSFMPFQSSEDTSLDITVEILQEHLDTYLEFNNGSKAPFLSDNRKLHSLGMKEKQFIVNKVGDFATAVAVIVDNPVAKFINNTFVAIYRPDVPNKAFTNKEKAFAWLEKYID